MTTRAQVELLRRTQRRLVSLAVSDLNRFWSALDLANPEAARDALLEFVPALTDRYGDIGSVVASDWFEEVRAASGLTSRFTPELGRAVRREVVQGSVRYAAGGLFTDTPGSTLALLGGAVDRFVKQPGRDTIRRSARRAGARFARVPTGAETCAFCFMLASRGFAYYDQDTAGGDQYHGTDLDRFHDDCDCQIVPDWSDDPSIEGYNPDEMYDQYSRVRGDDANDTAGILSRMREAYDLN